jgi:hypothetical protein
MSGSVPGGNKYRNLALQVGGVQKIETYMSPAGLNPRKTAFARPSNNLKLQTQPLVREGPHINKPVSV